LLLQGLQFADIGMETNKVAMLPSPPKTGAIVKMAGFTVQRTGMPLL